MRNWQGRQCSSNVCVRTLHSDSSDQAWAGIDVKSGALGQEFWREKPSPPHKCKRVASCNKHSQESEQTKGENKVVCRQQCGILLLDKSRRQTASFKCHSQTVSKVVHGQTNLFRGGTGEKFRGLSRCTLQMGSRHGGVYHRRNIVFPLINFDAPHHKSQSRHVYLPWKHKVAQFVARYPH